jgi:predicted phosphoribosyltransferase
MEFTHFKDREDAGAQLARQLAEFADNPNTVILALPRGGVPVGFQVACALHAPLDVLLVRKLGLPGHEEYAMGAIGSGGVRVLQMDVVHKLKVPPVLIQEVIDRETREIERREQLYRDGRQPRNLHGKIVVLVDDGLATGSTMRVAVEVVRAQKPARLIVAVPVSSIDARDTIAAEVDQMVCLSAPPLFRAVSEWYRHFDQTSDSEVQALLARARDNDPAEEEREAEAATQFIR